MSKVDAMQAMRAARYAARAAAPAATAAPVLPKVLTPAAAVPPVGVVPALDVDGAAGDQPELCGHRSMNGRVCRRPAAHPEKNHRYS